MVEISTSLLNAKKENIIDIIYEIEKAKTDYFHIDVMDGEFVKNNTHDLMLEYSEYLNQITKVPLDVHLMTKDVKNYIDSYMIFDPNIITFHYEACKDNNEVMELIKYVKEKGKRVGLSIKPNTKVSDIYEFLPYIHLVLVMSVEPGEGGQGFIDSSLDKIKEIDEYRRKESLDFDIEVDGGIKVENSDKIISAGADILVAGTAILESKDYKKIIKELK